jgi:hypothetical protein
MDVGIYNHVTTFTGNRSFGVGDIGDRGRRKVRCQAEWGKPRSQFLPPSVNYFLGVNIAKGIT